MALGSIIRHSVPLPRHANLFFGGFRDGPTGMCFQLKKYGWVGLSPAQELTGGTVFCNMGFVIIFW